MTTHAKAPATQSGRADGDATDLGGLITILRAHVRSILLTTLAALALAIAYLALASPVYTASTTVFIDPRSRKIVTDEVIQGGLGADVALVESQVAIIASDTVLRRVVDKLKLDEDPEFAPPRSNGPLSRLKSLIVTRAPEQDPKLQALNTLAGSVKVKRAQKTYVVDIEASASAPVKAARIAGEIVEAYLADQAAAKAAEARRANSLIDARLGELREQVRRAETRVDEFKKANSILTSEGGLVSEQQLGRLNGELTTARAVAAEARARHEQVTAALKTGGNPEALPDVVKSALIQRLREQHAQVARREAALASQLQPRHPVLIEVRSQLAELRNQITAELKRVAQSSNSELQIALSREREITRTLDRSKEEVSRSGTASIKLRELEAEANASRELLRVFLARSKETQAQENISTPDARIISPAAVPDKPSRPVSWLVLALGLFGGLGLGLARALLADHLDTTVRTPADAVRGTGLDSLGLIPILGRPGLGARTFAAGAQGPSASFHELLEAIASPRGRDAHAYRQGVLRLLAKLPPADESGETSFVLAVAPTSGAGASATALALAYAAAQSGERVLLVDAASHDAALSDVFAGDLKQDRVIVLDNRNHLASITVRDARSGLSFLPIALCDLRQQKASQRARLANGLVALSTSYDRVVIDGGALLEDESASSLLPIVDQIVLVAGAGRTTRAEVAETAAVLEAAADRIAGVAVVGAAPG